MLFRSVLSYFGQHQAQKLAGERSIVDTVYNAAADLSISQVRSLLGAFLFSGEAVEKQVRVLSGGEKSRVALAKILVRPANLLLLDEPTNHLDMSSQEVLQEAMARYEGSIIVVSHNRFFVNAFVNKVLEIKDAPLPKLLTKRTVSASETAVNSMSVSGLLRSMLTLPTYPPRPAVSIRSARTRADEA